MHARPVILVVDDEDNNRSLMEDFLTPLGYDVILAQDGEQALHKVHETAPDVVLLDVMMPKVDGFTVAKTLKSSKATQIIPVVMLTALMDMESRNRAFELGADDFFTKPVALVELKARMASLLKIKAYNDRMLEDRKHLEAEVARRTEQLQQVNEKIKGGAPCWSGRPTRQGGSASRIYRQACINSGRHRWVIDPTRWGAPWWTESSGR